MTDDNRRDTFIAAIKTAFGTQDGGDADTEVDALYEAIKAAGSLLGVDTEQIRREVLERLRRLKTVEVGDRVRIHLGKGGRIENGVVSDFDDDGIDIYDHDNGTRRFTWQEIADMDPLSQPASRARSAHP